jgi:hypothetical protein
MPNSIVPIRSITRLNFSEPTLQRLQDLLVGGINPFMRETGTALNSMDRYVGVPTAATSPGTPGDYAATATYLYVCVALNTWRRVAIAAW